MTVDVRQRSVGPGVAATVGGAGTSRPWGETDPERRSAAPPVRAGGSVPPAAAIWLGGGRWPLHGIVHEPAGSPLGAVVLCPPLFGELLAAQPLYRIVGQELAARGLLAVRFDYEGTGDSGGPSIGPGRLDAWLDGVDRAVATARERSRGPVVLLGVRSGALVASAAAEQRNDVDGIALWDPWRSGRSFLRREHALHALRLRHAPEAEQLEVAGLVLDAASAEAVSALRLPPRLRARRALLVVRPGTTPAAVPLETRRAGAPVRTTADVLEAAPGEQEALFEVDALHRRIPAATLTNVVGWVAGAVTQLAPGPTAAAAPGPAADATRGAAIRRAFPSAAVPASGLVAIPPAAPGEATVYERSVRIGRDGLFGVESLPSPDVPPEAPVVLFFPSGMDSHLGPNRLWVTLARRWASLGARCLRVDLSGLGESPPRPGRPELVMRAPEAFDDVAEVVHAVGGPERVVLVGLCSSAYQVLESAIELKPLGVMAVNPLLRFTPPELAAGGAVCSRRRLCQPRQAWEGTARRILPEPAALGLAALRRALGRWRSTLRRGTTGGARLALAGVDVHIVCRGYEAQQLAAFGLVDRPGEGLRVEVVPDLEHSLALAGEREDVADRLTRVLETMAGSRLHPARRARPSVATPVRPSPDEVGAGRRDRGREERA